MDFNSTVVQVLLKQTNRMTFSWYDYLFFALLILFSILIGIYFGCFGSKQSTTSEYLMGGKVMKVIPIAISLVASHISGITILSVPADVYFYGAGYWLGSFTMVFLGIITIYVYLPVFYELQITSTYEYLELRFDTKTRILASLFNTLSVFAFLPIVIYVPALAFSSATGISVHLITPVVCGACIFYTTIGGLKAVVWTDTLQFTITLGALITVTILGIQAIGGIGEMWKINLEGKRLDVFDFDLDPTKRDTFWIIMIGLTIHRIACNSINQGCTQKFLAVPTYFDAKMSVVYYCVGTTAVKTFCVLLGFLAFAKYSKCDPFTTQEVDKVDQLIPFFVMDVAGSIPGLPGLFIAGIFSAALSTLSATLNCLSATIYEDFIKKTLHHKITEKTASNILKMIVIVMGVLCTSLVFVIEHMGGLLPLAISLESIAMGPLLGLFTLGLLFPKANKKGAFYGAVGGIVTLASIVFVAKYYESQGLLKHPTKPVSTESCDFINITAPSNFTRREDLFDIALDYLNITDLSPDLIYFKPNLDNTTKVDSVPSEDLPNVIFRISHYYYSVIGSCLTVFYGLVISLWTNKNDPPVDKRLLSPVIHFLLRRDEKSNDKEYHSVEKALDLVTMNSDCTIKK